MIYETQNIENPNLKSSYTCTKTDHPSGQQYNTRLKAIALRNFLSEHAYPTMHEQPEIANIFDQLQSKVGM